MGDPVWDSAVDWTCVIPGRCVGTGSTEIDLSLCFLSSRLLITNLLISSQVSILKIGPFLHVPKTFVFAGFLSQRDCSVCHLEMISFWGEVCTHGPSSVTQPPATSPPLKTQIPASLID